MRIDIFAPRHCIVSLLLLALPAVVQAQFIFTTNNGAITITGYNGPGGAVVIPDATNGYAVTGIGDFAFEDGTNLTSITIPSGVTNIGEGPFLGCISLTNISVNADNPSYRSTNGVLFEMVNQNVNVLVAYPAGLIPTNGTYTVPSVYGIAEYAFASCPGLTNMVVDVSSIGDFAFIGCTGLTSVIITSQSFPGFLIGPVSIGEAAFIGCTSLTNVFIASAVTNVGDLAFAFCTNLTSAYFPSNAPPNDGTAFYGDPSAAVYYSLGTSGWGATFGGAPTEWVTPASEFEYNTYYGSIVIIGYHGPAGVVVIPAFINGTPVTRISSDAFEYSRATSVTIPDSVTNIGESAFDGSGLTNVVIPNSVTVIGPSAFAFCFGLTNIVFPEGVTSIAFDMFAECQNLASVTIPNGITNIGDSAFLNCPSLINVVIPNTVTGIGETAFFDDGSLTSVTIGSGVTSIGEGAFAVCGNLTNISVNAANSSYSSLNGILFDKAYDTLVQYPAGLTSGTYTIPGSVTSIGSVAFEGCSKLTSVNMPSSIASIGEWAFNDCASLASAYFLGNAPPGAAGQIFFYNPAIVYYLPGTSGWGPTFGGVPAVLWNPQATAFVTAGGQFGFNITGPTNTTIAVEACTNLANPVWLPVSTNTLSGGGTSSFSDPQRANYPNRYYRFSAP